MPLSGDTVRCGEERREREQAAGGCNSDITQNTICIIGSGCSSKLIMANWWCILPPYNTANCMFLTSSKLFWNLRALTSVVALLDSMQRSAHYWELYFSRNTRKSLHLHIE